MTPGVIAPMKVLFLDLDGVVNDDDWQRATTKRYPGLVVWSEEIGRAMIDPERLARVQAICDATGASIVIVSSWRRWASADVLSGILQTQGLKAPVIDAVGGVKFSGETRASATKEWLARHRDVTAYVIVDDNGLQWERFRDLCAHLVSPRDGIEDEEVVRAIEILSR